MSKLEIIEKHIKKVQNELIKNDLEVLEAENISLKELRERLEVQRKNVEVLQWLFGIKTALENQIKQNSKIIPMA
jgi:hypothetical protein